MKLADLISRNDNYYSQDSYIETGFETGELLRRCDGCWQ